MNRIYHPYNKWEDFKFGFYDNLSGKNKEILKSKVVELFSDPKLTEEYMQRVLNEWVYSCEHNLTNTSLNRIAYLGQCACCLFAGVTSSITMDAWHLVSKENRYIADSIAKRLIEKWEIKHNQLCLKLD